MEAALGTTAHHLGQNGVPCSPGFLDSHTLVHQCLSQSWLVTCWAPKQRPDFETDNAVVALRAYLWQFLGL